MFQADSRDVAGVFSCCVTPLATLPLMFSIDAAISAAEKQEHDRSILSPEVDRGDSSAISQSQSTKLNPPLVGSGRASKHERVRSRILDQGRGQLQFDEDSTANVRGCAVKIETHRDGQSCLTIVRSPGAGIDVCEEQSRGVGAEPFLTASRPILDPSRRSIVAINHEYQIGYREDGIVLTRVPQLHRYQQKPSESVQEDNKIHLRFAHGSECALTTRFDLKNGLQLTYDQINGLGGDILKDFGPIWEGQNFAERCNIFVAAFEWLKRDPTAVASIQTLLQNKEVGFEFTSHRGQKNVSDSPLVDEAGGSQVFPRQTRQANGLDDQASHHRTNEDALPSQLPLGLFNLDHFGEDARTAYGVGHHCAMAKAAEGKLEEAYVMNAIADHFLADCFIAGHMRTPRRRLHTGEALKSIATKTSQPLGSVSLIAPDLCSQVMHDEDNLRGLLCKNRAGKEWRAYGGERMLRPENMENLKIMQVALQASLDEVFECCRTGRIVVKTPQDSAGLLHAPILDDSVSLKNHSPLFARNGDLRKIIKDPFCYEHVKLGMTDHWVKVYQQLKKSNILKGA